MSHFEWVTLTYERKEFSVCISKATEEVDAIIVLDSQQDITPVMDHSVIEWMLNEALEITHLNDHQPHFKDMSQREIEIDEAGCFIEKVGEA